jgi:hypothetical protein
MKLVGLGFQVVRAMRRVSVAFALSAILAIALAPVTAGAGHDRKDAMPEPAAMDGPTADATAYSLGATTVRVRSQQRLYRFSGTTASVASERTVNFGQGAVFSSPGEVQKFGDRNYIPITSGPYDGWWVAAPSASASSITRYTTPLALKLSARDYVGVRFYDRGDVRSRLAVTIEAATVAHADRKGTFAGRNFYRITDGPMAGRWVNAHAVTIDKPGTDDGGTAAQPVATWKGIVLVYTQTDVTFDKADGSSYHLKTTMTNSMQNLLDSVLGKFHASVRNWSGGLVTMDLDIVRVPHPVTELGLLGSTYWVGPSQVRQDINDYAPAGSYDSVFVVWEAKDASGERVPTSAWGLTLPPGSWANGAGYSSIITPTWEWWWTDSVAPEEVFIHEWMHQVIYFNEQHDRPSVDLHAATDYGYSAVNGTWKRWLSDVMQGKVWDGQKFIGITPEYWAAGTPRNP